MILGDSRIKKELGTNIILLPYDEKQLNPNSYNLKLHNILKVYKDSYLVKNGQISIADTDRPFINVNGQSCLDMKKNMETMDIEIPEDGLILEPGILYLGRTVEYTETLKYIPMLEGYFIAFVKPL